MKEPFRFVSKVDVAPVVAELAAHPELWGQQAGRISPHSPHRETTDIWLRFRDLDRYASEYGDDMSHFVDEHESVWLPPAWHLPSAVIIAEAIAGDRPLGGILMSKTPPGASIKPHIDGGWHATAHDKFYVALQNDPGCVFHWEDGDLIADAGDVWEFRNDILHSVGNHSKRDRLAMIVCVRKEP